MTPDLVDCFNIKPAHAFYLRIALKVFHINLGVRILVL